MPMFLVLYYLLNQRQTDSVVKDQMPILFLLWSFESDLFSNCSCKIGPEGAPFFRNALIKLVEFRALVHTLKTHCVVFEHPMSKADNELEMRSLD